MTAIFKSKTICFLESSSTPHPKWLIKGLISGVILFVCIVTGFVAQPARAEGSRDLYPTGAQGSRASVEWRNSSYGGQAVLRRTLFKLYANAGEYILLGSSAVGAPTTPNYTVSNADILVYNPGLVTGIIGTESIPATASFSCQAQQAQTGNSALGRIGTRTQEIAGPDVILNAANGTTGGSITRYAPCYYQAPVSGIYNVVFYGPKGLNSNSETGPSGSIADVPQNFDASQDTTVSSWDVTVRFRLDNITPEFHGRLFSSYLALYTGDNARPLFSSIYPVSIDGYQYRADLRGLDPNGFLLYANQVGFYDTDGATPLYHDVLAAPNAFNQNQMSSLQGGVMLAPPLYPIFFNPPDPAALSALSIPPSPVVPVVNGLNFTGAAGGSTYLGLGGTFRYTSNVGGVYQLIISRDGVDFDPTNPLNRALGGIRGAGAQSIDWDGRDNSGNIFPIGGPYKVRFKINAGEVHFPLIDAENSPLGGPTYTLVNSPIPGCSNQVYGCTTVFYDDRGYRTQNGQIVGQLGVELCGQNPPPVPYPMSGADSASSARAYGATSNGNSGITCTAGGNGAFGDTKALDLWTFFPSNFATTIVIIVNQPTPAPTATPSASSTPITGIGGTPTPTSNPLTVSPGPGPTPTGGTPGGGSGAVPPGNGTPGAGDGSGGTGGGSGSGTPGTGGTTDPGTVLPGVPNTGRSPEMLSGSDSWLTLIGSFGLGLIFIGAGFYLLSDRKARNRK